MDAPVIGFDRHFSLCCLNMVINIECGARSWLADSDDLSFANGVPVKVCVGRANLRVSNFGIR